VVSVLEGGASIRVMCSDDRRRGQVLIGAGYQHDPELVIGDQAPKAFLLDHGSSSIDDALRS